MSLSYLRDKIIKELQEKADAASSRAVNNHPSGHTNTDTYAMQQIDALSEARACLIAIQVVGAAYRDMIEPEAKAKQDEAEQQPRSKEPIY